MNKKKRVILLVSGVLLIGLAVGYFIKRQVPGPNELVVSGVEEATDAKLGFQVPGRIETLTVKEGETVKKGTELGHLDRTEAEARRQQAVAQVAGARAMLRELERGFRSEEISQGRSAFSASLDKLKDAQRDFDRSKQLFDGGAISQEAFDKAKFALDLAKSQNVQTGEQLKILESGPRKEKIEAQKAQLKQAEAAMSLAEAVLANMVIVAPFDGLVTVRHHEPGEIVPAGSPIITLLNPDDRWARIYVPEYRMGIVKIGQPVTLSADTFPKKRYQGEVTYISSEAEFTPKTVQTVEERVKLVYAVKVRIKNDPTFELKPGLPVDVHLNGHDAG